MIQLLFYKLGAFFSHRLRPGLSEAIADSLSYFQYFSRFGSRSNVKRNLRVILGKTADPQNIDRLAKNTFLNFGRSIYLFLRLPYVDRKELITQCDFGALNEIQEKRPPGEGFILVSPHIGPWEVGAACLAEFGLRLNTVALDHPSSHVTRFFERRRAMMGIRSYPMHTAFVPLMEALQRGECVVLLIDRAYGSAKREFPWFDGTKHLPVGHLALSVRSGAPIVNGSCVFGEDGRFKFVFRGPYYPKKSLDEQQAKDELQQRCLDDMTDIIRSYPDQWFHYRPLSED